jgi:hypothetical protein
MRLGPLNLISALSILLLIAVSQSSAQTPQRDNRRRTASISGRVTLGGQPAANVTVTIVELDPRAGREFFGTSELNRVRERFGSEFSTCLIFYDSSMCRVHSIQNPRIGR